MSTNADERKRLEAQMSAEFRTKVIDDHDKSCTSHKITTTRLETVNANSRDRMSILPPAASCSELMPAARQKKLQPF